jgi:ABC-type branched-subunit amino acid transport system substrate-binding protein
MSVKSARKQRKKAAALVLGLTAMLLASACGGSAAGTGKSDGIPDSVVIPALLPMSGPAAVVGEQMAHGLQIWADEHNANIKQSGLPKVDFEIADSKADSKVAVQAYQRLRAKHPSPLLFSTYTNVGAAIAPFVQREGVVVLQGAQGTRTPELGENYVQTISSIAAQVDAVLKVGVEKHHFKDVVMIAPDDDVAFSDEAKRVSEKTCPALGCKLLEFVPQSPDGSDGSLAAIKAQRKHPEAILILGVPTQIEPVLQQLRVDKFEGPILGLTDFSNVLAGGNLHLLETAMWAGFYVDMESAATKSFIAKTQQRFKVKPQTYAYAAYKNGQMIDAMLAYMQKNKMSWNGDDIMKTLKSITVDTVAGSLSVGEDRRVHEPISVSVLKGSVAEITEVVEPER